MSIEHNAQIVKDFFGAIGNGDKQKMLAMAAQDIVWIIPGSEWPLAGIYRGHSGLEDLLRKVSEIDITRPSPPEFVAQGNRVLMIGVAEGTVKATSKSFVDHWVFDITVEDAKLTAIREYIDTQALARASAR